MCPLLGVTAARPIGNYCTRKRVPCAISCAISSRRLPASYDNAVLLGTRKQRAGYSGVRISISVDRTLFVDGPHTAVEGA
jgi:hypothetical protein